MNHRMPALALAAGAAFLALAAAAQPQPQAQPPAYSSAFEGYQPYTEQPVAPWRAANDNVGRIGGWRAYAREAQQGAAPAAPAAAASSPRPAPAGGHQHH